MKIKGKKGYILVMSVVLVSFLLFLSAAFIPFTMGIIDFQKRKQVEEDLEEIKQGILKYFEDTGTFISGLNDLGNPVQEQSADLTPVSGWRGPYVKGIFNEVLRDKWGIPRQQYIFRRQGQMMLLLSRGRNQQVDSNLTNWTNPGWQPAGDDIALVFTTASVSSALIEKTLNLLLLTKGQIYATNPVSPPAALTLNIRDAWGNFIRYRQCHRFASVIYSFGQNGVDDSAGGFQMCLLGQAGGDDIFVPLLWDISAQATGQVWKGGWGGNPDVCASYQITIWNLYPKPLRVDYYDMSYVNRTVNIGSNSSATIGSIPPLHQSDWVVRVSYQNDPIEGFHPSLVDLDSDCLIMKIYGFEY
ncbi:MAG: hypothetical protein V2G48_02185 [bacterium JZ-2024 1]